MSKYYVAVDLVKIYSATEKKENFKTILAWGDEVEMEPEDITPEYLKIKLRDFKQQSDGSILPTKTTGYILKSSGGPKLSEILKPIANKDVLQVSFVDVQQGDGCVIQTPKGQVILLDGGENQMFARYLAARFAGTSKDQPLDVACIIVSHGDADHFEGLPLIAESEINKEPRKQLFINPLRIFHNGIVKRPSKKSNGDKRIDKDLLGPTVEHKGELYLTGLEDDLILMDDSELNQPFKAWKKTLKHYQKRNPALEMKRLDHMSITAFDFLTTENIKVDVLGPITTMVGNKTALKFLKTPPKKFTAASTGGGAYSASHTINGHSAILRLQYGHVKFLFAGDLNEEAEDILVRNSSTNPLQSEVLKVPHHGSADFSTKFLKAVQPLVSVVSSGDESEAKEYIHPRATLMGALGKYSSIDRPLVFVTELVAFFKMEGWSKTTAKPTAKNPVRNFFGFSRTAYGIVHVRTDGKRLLIFTHSGQKDLKESYAYEMTGAKPVRKDVIMG